MAKAALGATMEMLHALRALVAANLLFQEWCREDIDGFPEADDEAASLAAALDRVHLVAVRFDNPAAQRAARPYCLICPLPKQELETDSNALDGYVQNGISLIEFVRSVSAEQYDDVAAAVLDFTGWQDDADDTEGGADVIIEQVIQAAADDGTVFVRGVELVDGPAFPEEDEQRVVGLYLGICYAVHWGLKG